MVREFNVASDWLSCISSVRRGEDNGSDNEDNLDDGQQGRTPPRLSVPCENRSIQTDVQAQLPLLAQSRHPDRVSECPLSGVKRTSRFECVMSGFDPNRTLHAALGRLSHPYGIREGTGRL